jgi:hypothetical protein
VISIWGIPIITVDVNIVVDVATAIAVLGGIAGDIPMICQTR